MVSRAKRAKGHAREGKYARAKNKDTDGTSDLIRNIIQIYTRKSYIFEKKWEFKQTYLLNDSITLSS